MTNEKHVQYETIDRAFSDIGAGKCVIVVDDNGSADEGYLIFAAEKATTELVAFAVRHTSGFLCVSMTDSDCDRLNLPLMYSMNQDRGVAFAVSVDAKIAAGTGISATDRATTLRSLANEESTADSFTRPGHVMPLRAREGGVLQRPGQTEAGVDLARLSGQRPVAAMAAIVSKRNEAGMACTLELRNIANVHGIAMIRIADLITWRIRHDQETLRTYNASAPTDNAEFRAIGYRRNYEAKEGLAIILGNAGIQGILLKIHMECSVGDVFGSTRCYCREHLDAALAAIVDAGSGIILYLKPFPGISTSIAHCSKSEDFDREDIGEFDYSTERRLLLDLGVPSVKILTGSPSERRICFEDLGVPIIEYIPLPNSDRMANYKPDSTPRIGNKLSDGKHYREKNVHNEHQS